MRTGLLRKVFVSFAKSVSMPKVVRLSILLTFALPGLIGCGTDDTPLVAFLGDSLTDGWGLSREEAYPALVGRDLSNRGQQIRVLNAGRGGDTAAQGRGRLDDLLGRRPDVLVVALGINDALRGLSVDDAERDLRGIVVAARAQGARVVLVGIQAPPPLATPHTQRFAAMYRRLADGEDVDFVPDLLAGAAGNPERMFPDALHPNAAGQRQLAVNVLPAVELALERIPAPGRVRLKRTRRLSDKNA